MCPLEATPQRAVPDQVEEAVDTIPASDSQVEISLHGSDKGVPSPTSPTSSMPSSAGKSQDQVHWKIRIGNCTFFVRVLGRSCVVSMRKPFQIEMDSDQFIIEKSF